MTANLNAYLEEVVSGLIDIRYDSVNQSNYALYQTSTGMFLCRCGSLAAAQARAAAMVSNSEITS